MASQSSDPLSSLEARFAEFREHGCVLLPQLLDAETLAHCRRAYDWSMAHPSKIASDRNGTYDDGTGTKGNFPVYKELLEARPVIGRACAKLFGSRYEGNVWYYDTEIWRKTKNATRTNFHQDTGIIPFEGTQMVVFWINFEAVPQENSLEIVRGSFRGPRYAHPIFSEKDQTKPRFDEEKQRKLGFTTPLPRVPDIQKDRSGFDITSWALQPGDVLAFHPGSLHGGAPVSDAFPVRNTLVLRFFGDDCWFKALPGQNKKIYGHMRDGEHFSKARGLNDGKYLHLLGPGPEQGEPKQARL